MRGLTASSWMKLYIGVFFTFMPVFMLFGDGVRTNGSLPTLLFWGAVSGCIGTAYAVISTRGLRKLLYAVIPAHVLLVWVSAMGLPRGLALDFDGTDGSGLFIILSIALGYGFFTWFVRTEGARSYRLAEEMRLAARIHESLVPGIRLEMDRARVFAESVASTEMGGDLIDAVAGGDGSLTLYLADVSGHGVRAGVLMAMLKSAIRATHLRPISLEQTCAELNAVLGQVKEPDMFATFAAVRIDGGGAGGGRVECALAGHLPIVQIDRERGEITRHDNESLPLGVVDDETFVSKPIGVRSGDLLALYTDGLTEAADAQRRLFGAEAVDRVLLENRDEPLEAIFDAVMDAVRAHDTGGQADDQTLMLIRIK